MPNPKPVIAEVALKSTAHNEFVCAYADGNVGLAPHCKGWETFQLVEGPNGTKHLRSAHGLYLSAWTEGHFGQQPHAKEWESFVIEKSDDAGSSTIKTHHGTYMSAWDDHASLKQQPHAQGWEMFEMVILSMPNPKPAIARVALKSTAHNEFVCAYADGNVGLAPHCKGWEIFDLVDGPNGTKH